MGLQSPSATRSAGNQRSSTRRFVQLRPVSQYLSAACHWCGAKKDRQRHLLISYDTQAIARQKADYINQMGLGGAMFWELDADKPEETGGAIVRTVRDALGQLQWKENELGYPGSSE